MKILMIGLMVVMVWGTFIHAYNEDHLALVLSGSKNLQHLDLSSADLSGLNLDDSDLDGTNLRHAKLRGTYLRSANLSYADCTGANLWSAHLQDAICDYTIFKKACLSYAFFNRTSMRHADFTRAVIRNVKLLKVNASFAWFRYAKLGDIVIDKSILVDVNLSGAHLYKVTFKNSVMMDVLFSNLRNNGYALKGVITQIDQLFRLNNVQRNLVAEALLEQHLTRVAHNDRRAVAAAAA